MNESHTLAALCDTQLPMFSFGKVLVASMEAESA